VKLLKVSINTNRLLLNYGHDSKSKRYNVPIERLLVTFATTPTNFIQSAPIGLFDRAHTRDASTGETFIPVIQFLELCLLQFYLFRPP